AVAHGHDPAHVGRHDLAVEVAKSLLDALADLASAGSHLVSPYVSHTVEAASQLLQPRRHAGVYDPIADPDDEAAKDRRVHARFEHDLPGQPARQVASQALLLPLGELDGSGGGSSDPSGSLVDEGGVLLQDVIRHADATRLDDELR